MISLPGRRRVWQAIHRLERQLMSQQDEVNALATANPALNLTGLQAAVAPLDQAAKDLASLKPTPVP